jgi:hypothetical protein
MIVSKCTNVIKPIFELQTAMNSGYKRWSPEELSKSSSNKTIKIIIQNGDWALHVNVVGTKQLSLNSCEEFLLQYNLKFFPFNVMVSPLISINLLKPDGFFTYHQF